MEGPLYESWPPPSHRHLFGDLTLKPVSRLATWYSYVTKQCDCVMVTAER